MVRCPKCGHLLPELNRYAANRCGGCNNVLKAEKESSVNDDLVEKSGGNRSGNGGRVVGVDLARGGGRRSPGRVSKSPVRSRYDENRKSPLRGRMPGDFDDRSKSSGRSTDGDDRRTPLRKPPLAANPEEIQARDKVGAWVEHVKEEVGYVNKLVLPTESFNGWLPGEAATNQDQTDVNKSSRSPRKRRTWNKEDPSIGFGPKQIPDQIGEEYGNSHGTKHVELVDVSFNAWVEEDGYGGRRRNTDLRVQDGYVEVYEKPRGRMEQREAERIGFRGVHGNDILPSVRQRVPIDPYEAPSNYLYGSYYGHDERQSSRSHYNGPANLQNVAMKQAELLRKYNELGEELHKIGDLSYNQGGRGDQGDFYGDPDDYVHEEYLRGRRGNAQYGGPNGSSRMRHNYAERYMPNGVPFHDDPSSPRTSRRTTHHEPHYYPQQFAQRRPMDSVYGPRTENLVHQHVDVYDYKRHPNSQAHQAPDYPNPYVKRTVDSKLRNPTPNNLSSISRSSVDSKSDGSSSVPDRAKRVLVVGQKQQLCHPFAGGAPFVTCSNCSQLLRLPGKLRTIKKNQYRLQCGSCHKILSFDFDKKRSKNSLPNATIVHDVPCEAVSKSDDKDTHHKSFPGFTHCESYDLKSTGDTFPNSDSERSSELRPVLSPSSSTASKDDKFSEAVGQTDASSSKAEKPLTNELRPLRPPPGSPLRYNLDYSDILAAKESGEDKGSVERDSSSLNYVESAAIQTKLDPISNEVPKTDASIRKDQGSPSLPGTYISPAEPDVFVNGQPITHDALRRAEMMAGPIKPGDYWYDSKAGFWGLKGSHCLGIVAPFIKEFRAPMPENCSGGDTCIYVNGRELHKNDLDLLSSRRLPRTRYKYYRVDLSGKVEDEDTGRFVVNLGKLAPNVERTGRGFGMQPPEMQNG